MGWNLKNGVDFSSWVAVRGGITPPQPNGVRQSFVVKLKGQPKIGDHVIVLVAKDTRLAISSRHGADDIFIRHDAPNNFVGASGALGVFPQGEAPTTRLVVTVIKAKEPLPGGAKTLEFLSQKGKTPLMSQTVIPPCPEGEIIAKGVNETPTGIHWTEFYLLAR
jgi:hypothetical protein